MRTYGYRSSFKPKRKTFRKRSSGTNYGQLAVKAFNMATKVASLVNTEWKYHDLTWSAANITNTISFQTCGSSIAQGDDDEQRSGNSILPKSYMFRGNIQRNSSGAAVQLVRLLIFRDNNVESDTAPTLPQILDTTTTGVAIYSPLNKDGGGERFRILVDRVYELDANNPSESVSKFGKIGMLKDKKGNRTVGQHITFNGSAGTDTDKGHLYILLISDQTANYPTFTGVWRLNYIDN